MCDDIKVGELSGAARMSFFARATAGANHIRTGRSIVANGDHALASEWKERGLSHEFESHEGFDRFRKSLCELGTVDTQHLSCFRGRPFPLHEKPNSNQMGPPSSQIARSGRYNQAGQRVLYLCNSADGVLREIEDDGRVTWVQEFKINLVELRIVDTRLSADDSFVNQVFWFTESSDSRIETVGPTFSQRIAKLVSEYFDGMLVRGVRGLPDAHYSNIVLFSQLDEWEKWLVSESYPVQLRPNHKVQPTPGRPRS